MNRDRSPNQNGEKSRCEKCARTPPLPILVQISFLSSSFEPRPTFAVSYFLICHRSPSIPDSAEGVAVLSCLLRPAHFACRGCRFYSSLAVLEQYEASVRCSPTPSLRVEATPPPRLHRSPNQISRFALNETTRALTLRNLLCFDFACK